MNIEHKSEAGTFVYQDSSLVAVIKRDEGSGKTIVYSVKEATATEIAALIKAKQD